MATLRDKKKAKKQRKFSNAKKQAEKQTRGFEPKAFRVPKGVELLRPKEGKYNWDVVPYTVKNYGDIEPGTLHYEREYAGHRLKVPGGSQFGDIYCCPGNWGKFCPVCADNQRLKNENEKLGKDVAQKHRQLWLLRDADKPNGPIYLHDSFLNPGPMGSKGLGDLINRKLNAKSDDHPYQHFFYPGDEGKTLEVVLEKGNYGAQPIELDMVERKHPVTDELIDRAPCLDELLIEIPAKKLKDLYEQAIGADGAKGDYEDEEDEDASDTEAEDREPEENEEEEDEEDEEASDEDDEEEEDADEDDSDAEEDEEESEEEDDEEASDEDDEESEDDDDSDDDEEDEAEEDDEDDEETSDEDEEESFTEDEEEEEPAPKKKPKPKPGKKPAPKKPVRNKR